LRDEKRDEEMRVRDERRDEEMRKRDENLNSQLASMTKILVEIKNALVNSSHSSKHRRRIVNPQTKGLKL